MGMITTEVNGEVRVHHMQARGPTVFMLADTRACHMSHAKREIGFRQLRDARHDSAWAHALSRCDRDGVRDGELGSWACI